MKDGTLLDGEAAHAAPNMAVGQEDQPPPVLEAPNMIQMVTVENVRHEPFTLTQEVKVSENIQGIGHPYELICFWPGGWVVPPDISHLGMCRSKGYHFLAFIVWKRVQNSPSVLK